MKQILIYAVIVMSFSRAYSQNNSACLKDIRDGKFKYEDKLEDVLIVRKKRKQIEYSNGGKSKLKTKIVWENDSTYVLTHKRSVNDPGCLDKGDRIVVTILTCNENRYYATYTSNKCGSGRSGFVKIE